MRDQLEQVAPGVGRRGSGDFSYTVPSEWLTDLFGELVSLKSRWKNDLYFPNGRCHDLSRGSWHRYERSKDAIRGSWPYY